MTRTIPSWTHTIELRRTPAGWVAKFSEPAVKAGCGTDTLQTGFTAAADAATVLNEIQALNPGCCVRVY